MQTATIIVCLTLIFIVAAQYENCIQVGPNQFQWTVDTASKTFSGLAIYKNLDITKGWAAFGFSNNTGKNSRRYSANKF